MKFPGGMGNMMAQAAKMQNEMKAVQAKLAKEEYDVESAGGRIKIRINGKQEIISLDVSKELIDPEDPDMLNDMMKIAINEALEFSQKQVSEAMAKVVPPGMSGLLGF